MVQGVLKGAMVRQSGGNVGEEQRSCSLLEDRNGEKAMVMDFCEQCLLPSADEILYGFSCFKLL